MSEPAAEPQPEPSRPPRLPWLTMALDLALIATIFLTRERWEAWVVERELAPSGHGAEILSLAPARGGTRIVVSGFGWVRLLDAGTGKELAEVWPCAWSEVSADGSHVLAAVAEGPHQTGLILDCGSGTERRLDVRAQSISALAISRDGSRCVVATGDEAAGIWDVDSGRRLFALEEPGGPVTSAEFSPDGATIATGGGDGAIRVWDARTGRARAMMSGHACRVRRLVFSADGRRLVSYDGAECRVWDAEKGTLVLAPEGAVYDISPNGSRLATALWDEVCVWDVRTGKRIAALGPNETEVREVRLSPDAARLAASLEGGTVRVWDAAGGDAVSVSSTSAAHTDFEFALRPVSRLVSRPVPTITPFPYWWELAFTPDSRRMLTWDSFERPHVWDAETGDSLAVIPGGSPCHVLDDRRICVTGEPGGLHILRRIRPEQWWGVFWLWHFWLIVALGGALVWSGWRDLRRMRGLEAA